MKSQVVRGTPINHVGSSATRSQGMNHGAKPQGMSGTVNKSFEGDQRSNLQEGISTGTPYQSADGNSGGASTTRLKARYGEFTVNGGQDMNSPSSNGNGVLLDGMSRDKGYQPRDVRTKDSPVLESAPWFDTRSIKTEIAEHLSGNTSEDLVEDDLVGITGGVMSR